MGGNSLILFTAHLVLFSNSKMNRPFHFKCSLYSGGMLLQKQGITKRITLFMSLISRDVALFCTSFANEM